MLPKTQLQKLCELNLWNPPEYSNLKEGPDHKPSFIATVIVNGVSFRSSNPCGTLKAAMNSAAEVALNQLSDSPGSGSKENSPTLDSLPSDFPASQNGLEAESTIQAHTGNVIPLGGQHWYKHRLQTYSQKKNIGLPSYSVENQGPKHASRFKCKVTVGGQIYEGTDVFATRKEAENDAAKIAYQQVSLNEDKEDDVGLHKSVLQELAHKKGFLFPCYKTESCGPGHSPSFISTVTVDGKSYQGLTAKNKKQAEVNAAKSAYHSLQNADKAIRCENPSVISVVSEETDKTEKRPRSPTTCENVVEASEEVSTIVQSPHKILVYPRLKVQKLQEK